jgi:hypothetical protein
MSILDMDERLLELATVNLFYGIATESSLIWAIGGVRWAGFIFVGQPREGLAQPRDSPYDGRRLGKKLR